MNEEGGQPERDGAGGILGVALGLSLFAAAIYVALSSNAKSLNSPADVWAEYFDGSSKPSGFEFTAAARLPGDREVVKLRRVGALEVIEPEATPGASEGESSSEEAPVEWDSLAEGEGSLDPDELVFVLYPGEDSGTMLGTYFQGLDQQGFDELGEEGGTVIIESGELNWLGFETNFVRQRKFRERAGEREFVDSLRVNLSVGQSCVLIALWAPGIPSDVSQVEALLKGVNPRSVSGT